MGRKSINAEAKKDNLTIHALVKTLRGKCTEQDYKMVESLLMKREETIRTEMKCEVGSQLMLENESLKVENLILKDATKRCNELLLKVEELEEEVKVKESLRKKAEEGFDEVKRDRDQMELGLRKMEEVAEKMKCEMAMKIEELKKVVEFEEAKCGEVMALKLNADECLMNCKREYEAMRLENLKLMNEKRILEEERGIELELKCREESRGMRNNTEEGLQAFERKFKELELMSLKMQKDIGMLRNLVLGAGNTGLRVEKSHPDEAWGEAEIPDGVKSSVPTAVLAAKNAMEGEDFINSVTTANMKRSSLVIGVNERCADRESKNIKDAILGNKLEELEDPPAKPELGRYIEDPSNRPLGSKNSPCIIPTQLENGIQLHHENECDTPEILERFKRKFRSIGAVKSRSVSPSWLIQKSKKVKLTEVSLTPSSGCGDRKTMHYAESKEIDGNVNSKIEKWKEQLLEKLLCYPDDDSSDSSSEKDTTFPDV